MSTRRDFLAFTAGAVVVATVLPVAARVEPQTAREQLEAMAEWDAPTAKLLNIWDEANPHERLCIMLMIKRVYYGLDVAEAGEMYRLDLVDPSRSIGA